MVLPGGYMLGYASILNPNPLAMPDLVLRDSSGKVLIKTDDFVRLDRDPDDPTRFYLRYSDVSVNFPGEKLMPLIWYWNGWYWDDEGLGAAKRRKWNEPKPGLPRDLSIMAIGLSLIYDPLIRSGEFDVESCNTPWFDWGE
ncbi:hypothetical protein AUC68_05645 [Methyloceanibacter methanicus]|uniref:Uncharacterized protein n=1 Tax=Methyloceanibacter methanicus TaxID=1774968 RepID=A0A1E3W116_9HYPH|nr:hypothetical protein AUC68_05645 [Methyloceanibacter methanicus]